MCAVVATSTTCHGQLLQPRARHSCHCILLLLLACLLMLSLLSSLSTLGVSMLHSTLHWGSNNLDGGILFINTTFTGIARTTSLRCSQPKPKRGIAVLRSVALQSKINPNKVHTSSGIDTSWWRQTWKHLHKRIYTKTKKKFFSIFVPHLDREKNTLSQARCSEHYNNGDERCAVLLPKEV